MADGHTVKLLTGLALGSTRLPFCGNQKIGVVLEASRRAPVVAVPRVDIFGERTNGTNERHQQEQVTPLPLEQQAARGLSVFGHD